MSTNKSTPDHLASPPRASDEQPLSLCVAALDALEKWSPIPNAAVTLIVGECGCKDGEPFASAVFVIQQNVIAVFGGLDTNADVAAFKDALAAKVSPVQPFEFDGRADGVVVPCPPPRPSLTDVEAVVLTAAAQIPHKNLAEVFTMGSQKNAPARERTTAPMDVVQPV